jgi:hypothetical protein
MESSTKLETFGRSGHAWVRDRDMTGSMDCCPLSTRSSFGAWIPCDSPCRRDSGVGVFDLARVDAQLNDVRNLVGFVQIFLTYCGVCLRWVGQYSSDGRVLF